MHTFKLRERVRESLLARVLRVELHLQALPLRDDALTNDDALALIILGVETLEANHVTRETQRDLLTSMLDALGPDDVRRDTRGT